MNKSTPHPWSSRVGLLLFGSLAILALLALFCHSPSTALIAQDAPAYWFQRMHGALTNHFFQVWFIEPWLGQRYGPISPDLNAFLLGWIGYPYSQTLMAAVNLFIGGLGMYTLLRVMQLNPGPCCFGGLAFLMTNTAITLIYPGHTCKLMTFAWLPFSIAAFLAALETGKIRYYVLSGAFLGVALLGGEVQVPYYLGLWYCVWLVFHLIRRWRVKDLTPSHLGKHMAGLGLLAACSLIWGASTALHSISYLSETRPVAAAISAEENWQFATQFYFPPEEILSYLTTVQFFGGPHAYWGRDGNPTPLRLTDDYMGLLPLGLAILGGITCWRIWPARLFAITGIGSLLISFGREGGLYWLLYQLPTMKSQRNPHRWSYFVALATCVLAAYGINWLLQRLDEAKGPLRGHDGGVPPSDKVKATEKSSPLNDRHNGNLHYTSMEVEFAGGPIARKQPRWFFWRMVLLATGVLGAMFFITTGILSHHPEPVAGFWYPMEMLTSPQGPLAVERTRMMLASLMRTGFFLGLSATCIWWLIHAALEPQEPSRGPIQQLRRWLPFSVMTLVMLLDLGFNSKRYIQFHNWRELLEHKDLVDFLKQDKDFFRVKVLGVQQNQLLNQLVSFILPYHQIPVVDPPAISRMPVVYEKFFEYCKNHYVRSDRYLDFFNIKYVLSATPYQDPVVKLTPVAQWHGIQICRREDFMPRAWLATRARVITGGDEAVLSATLHPGLDFREMVVLTETPAAVTVANSFSTPAGPQANQSGKNASSKKSAPDRPPSTPVRPQSARIVRYEDNQLEVETEAGLPTMLVLSEKWDPDWKAWVNGQPSRIFRANFLMRAVEIPPGKNLVRMEYRPRQTCFWISAGCVLGLALAGIGYGWRRGWSHK